MKWAWYYLGLVLFWFGLWLTLGQPDRALKIVGLLCILCGAALALAMLKRMPQEEAKPQPKQKPTASRRSGCGVLIVIFLLAMLLFFRTAGEITCTGFQCTIQKKAAK